MAIDPVCGMTVKEQNSSSLMHQDRTYYFCSRRCRVKFAEEHEMPSLDAVPARPIAFGALIKNKTILATLLILLVLVLSFLVPLLVPFRHSLTEYFTTIWWAVLLGLVLGGVIDHYVPRSYVSHLLARPRKATIFYAVLLGFIMSACSHGILAIAIQLHKKGASTAAVVAFLLASPWANLPLTIMLFGFFGAGALFVIVSALLVGITTGLIYQFLETRGIVERQTIRAEHDDTFSITEDIKKRIRRFSFSVQRLKNDIRGVVNGTLSLGNMVLWWIIIGMGLASLASAYVPAGIFVDYLGPSIMGLFITLAFATVIEVCSEGSAPLAFEIFRQTGALGNSFTFLMAGVATDYTEIGLLWHNVGKKTAMLLPIVAVPQILLLSLVANIFF